MAILMRYEQVQNQFEGGLALVSREFEVKPERVRQVVIRERWLATHGERVMLRQSLPIKIRKRVYGY